METKPRPSGLQQLGDLSLGTHFCLFYETPQDLLETLIPYFKAGLANNELCLWITPDSLEQAQRALRQALPSADQSLAAGQIEILSSHQWYGADGTFDATGLIQRFEAKLAQALEAGYARLRVLADEAWLGRADWRAYSDYEAHLDDWFASKPLSIMCAYSTANRSAADILDVARTHRFVAAKRDGNWEFLEAPELRRARAESERAVTEFGGLAPGQKTSEPPRRRLLPAILRYALPILSVGLSLAATFLLQPYVFRTPLFFLSIMISTWVGGFGPGLLAVFLSTLAINVFLSPAGILETRFQNIPNVISFLITALLVGSWSEARRRAEHALRQAREELEDRVRERTAHLSRANQALQAEIIERHLAEAALKDSSLRLQVALQAAQIGTGEWDLRADQVSLSEGLRQIYGFAPGTFHTSFADFAERVHPEDRERFRSKLAEALAGETDFGLDYRVVWPDGGTRWVTGRAHIERDELGQATRMVGASMDITARKLAEVELLKHKEILQTVFDHVPAMITMVDQDGRFILTNRDFESRLGWRQDDIRDQNPDLLAELYPDPQARQAVLEFVGRADGRWEEFETRTTEGRVIDTAWAIVRLSDGAIIGVGQDITERRRAEAALRESEAKLREAQQLAHIGYWERDLITDRITLSEETTRIFWQPSPNGLQSLAQLQEIIHPNDRQIQQRALSEALQGSGRYDVEYRLISPEGEIRFIHTRGEVVYSESGQPIRLFGTVQDITERKQAEEALHESQQRLALIYNNTKEYIVLIRAEGIGRYIIESCNEAYILANQAAGISITSEQLAGMSVLCFLEEFVRSDQAKIDFIFEKYQEAVTTRNILRYDEETRLDSVIIYHETTLIPILDTTGECTNLLYVSRDITDRKQAEEALRQSEERFSKAFHANPIPATIARFSDGRMLDVNQAKLDLSGYQRIEMIGRTALDLNLYVHPEVRESLMQKLRDGEPVRGIEVRYRTRGGKILETLVSMELIEVANETCVLNTVMDITERKRAEQALRRSEDQLRRVIDTIPTMAWTVQSDGTVDYLNQRWMDYSGLSLEQYVDDPARPIHPEDVSRVFEKWRAHMAAGEPYEDEMRIRGADGQHRWFLVRTAPLRDESGKIVKWYGVSTDIDEHKRAEETIRRQSARAQLLADVSRAFSEVALNYEAVLKAIARLTAEAIGDACVMTLFSEDQQRSFPVAFYHADPNALAMMHEALLQTWPGGTDTQRYSTLLSGESVYLPMVKAEEFRATLEPEFWPFLETFGISSVLIVPIRLPGQVIGTLGLTRDRNGVPYTREDHLFLQDIADRAALTIQNARLFQEVSQQRERLGLLSARLAEAQEAERRAVARELHDEIGQLLYAVSANLEAVRFSPEAHRTASQLAESAGLVDEAIHQVRDLALELRPSMLDDFGLAPAVAWLVERQAQRAGFQADFAAEPTDLRLPPALETTMYRLVQAALTNVARHAHARQVHVSIRRRGADVELLVSDDGTGFDLAAAQERARKGATLGLLSMEERARLAGGLLEIVSAPGRGTQVRARFPIEGSDVR